eukprot:CAMPEP_0177694300 /NCGR_PEP_ID=MMETSP0484_2-20121128/2861_1 /TAXON_ID=354590 /ORGANISM="Rhodomonas lens, Strain RHODO" /LENGTH=118 /DNA_ID=CAMNT_0019205171 /DNA_START=158 /DNA_END=514 /DNA_ORIENTATION=+
MRRSLFRFLVSGPHRSGMHIPFYGTDHGHRALRDLATRNAAELSEAEPPGLHVEDAPRLLVSVAGERRRVEGLAGPGDAVFEGGVEPDGVRLAPSNGDAILFVSELEHVVLHSPSVDL